MDELTYLNSGVNIDAGNSLIKRIKPVAKSTHRQGVLNGLGGFNSLFELPLDRYNHPVLVSGTDGVGTKLKLTIELNQFDTIGIDLVAMCVNDILVSGAEPLFFLDYYATGQLDIECATSLIKGIAVGCLEAGVALVGGETAEMPGLYQGTDYDLAGFAVGIVEKEKIIDGSRVEVGDVLIGLASSGCHSNGFSLIRKVLQMNDIDLLNDKTLGETLLRPTRIYVKSILKLLESVDVKAMAHITGGGLVENLLRTLPKNVKAIIDYDSWERQEIFNWLKLKGNIPEEEMQRTFNCGVGLVITVDSKDADQTILLLEDCGETAWKLGRIE